MQELGQIEKAARCPGADHLEFFQLTRLWLDAVEICQPRTDLRQVLALRTQPEILRIHAGKKAHDLEEKRLLHAFKLARPRHYGSFFLLRSPALISAVVVYTIALNLFGVDASVVSMIGYLPVIFFAATVPTPMRAAAITSWVILFPGNEGEMAAFGFVQHNFFILFNATIGLAFVRRAQRDMFGQ